MPIKPKHQSSETSLKCRAVTHTASSFPPLHPLCGIRWPCRSYKHLCWVCLVGVAVVGRQSHAIVLCVVFTGFTRLMWWSSVLAQRDGERIRAEALNYRLIHHLWIRLATFPMLAFSFPIILCFSHIAFIAPSAPPALLARFLLILLMTFLAVSHSPPIPVLKSCFCNRCLALNHWINMRRDF